MLHRMTTDRFTFQQNSVPVHRSRESCFSSCEYTQVHWARALATKQTWIQSTIPFGSIAATCLMMTVVTWIIWKKWPRICWDQVGQDMIDKVINQWLARIWPVIRAKEDAFGLKQPFKWWSNALYVMPYDFFGYTCLCFFMK